MRRPPMCFPWDEVDPPRQPHRERNGVVQEAFRRNATGCASSGLQTRATQATNLIVAAALAVFSVLLA